MCAPQGVKGFFCLMMDIGLRLFFKDLRVLNIC